MARILIFDDEDDFLFLWRITLERADHEVFTRTSGEKALDWLKSVEPDLVITDIMMPGTTGGTIYEMIRTEIGPHIPVIFCSSSALKSVWSRVSFTTAAP